MEELGACPVLNDGKVGGNCAVLLEQVASSYTTSAGEVRAALWSTRTVVRHGCRAIVVLCT
eukprot:54977-Eustigmatos_ZCMA.PRE.1